MDVVIPSTVGGVDVTKVGEKAFEGALISTVVMPDTITEIGNNLTEVYIPTSVTSIGELAFAWNPDLKTAYIPNTLTDIAEDSFPEDCEIIRYGVITDTITFLGGIVTATVYELSPFMVALVDESLNTENEQVTEDTNSNTEEGSTETKDETSDAIDSTNPQTGDTTNAMAWMLVMVAMMGTALQYCFKEDFTLTAKIFSFLHDKHT